MTGPSFRPAWEEFRCPATAEVGRCGLYRGHDGEHAHGEIVSRKPWRDRVWRWTDGGAPWVQHPAPRLAWCALHHD